MDPRALSDMSRTHSSTGFGAGSLSMRFGGHSRTRRSNRASLAKGPIAAGASLILNKHHSESQLARPVSHHMSSSTAEGPARSRMSSSAIGWHTQCPDVTKETTYFNVGQSRNARKMRQALSTTDESARLRRFEQVFQDTSIYHEKRFEPDLVNMREEAFELASLAAFKLELKFEEEARLAREFEEGLAPYKEFLARQAEQAKIEAALRIQKMMRGKRARRRFFKLKTSYFLTVEDHDQMNENGEVDLRCSRYWNERSMFVCDIKEKDNEKSNDFLFLADISADGAICQTRRGRCIFNNVMYDVQDFVPKAHQAGHVEFSLSFGMNTKERKDKPEGFKISFNVVPTSPGRFVGTCVSSWWGTRKVELIQYTLLSEGERQSYPDLVAKYYRSWMHSAPQ